MERAHFLTSYERYVEHGTLRIIIKVTWSIAYDDV